jgi:hypothetical protein
MDTRGSSLRENLLGCEVHPSPPTSAEFKNDWSYNSIPQYAFHDLLKKILPLFLKGIQ